MKTIYKVSVLVLFMLSPVLSKGQFKLQPSLGFGSQSISYDYEGATVEGTPGVTLGADLFYYLSEDFAVGAGVRFASYKATAAIGDYSFTKVGTDKDGDVYDFTQTMTGIDEKHTLSAIEIPLLARYQKWVSGSMIVFGSTGPVFVVPGSLKTEFNAGTIATSGYYEKWDLNIDEASEYGFGTQDLTLTEPELDPQMGLSWALEIGAEYFINQRINLMLTAYFQPGLSGIIKAGDKVDLASDLFAFRGTMAGADNVKISKVGIRLGINFDLTPPERASIKSIR